MLGNKAETGNDVIKTRNDDRHCDARKNNFIFKPDPLTVQCLPCLCHQAGRPGLDLDLRLGWWTVFRSCSYTRGRSRIDDVFVEDDFVSLGFFDSRQRFGVGVSFDLVRIVDSDFPRVFFWLHDFVNDVLFE